MGAPHDLGVRGEELAARHLERLGFRTLARNYRFGHREIDLIVGRGDLVVFVEVKTRAGEGFGHPFEAITALKRREIERVARAWQRQHGRPGLHYRFDAIGILFRPGSNVQVEHLPNAWRMGE